MFGVGDSITAGYLASDRATLGWAPLLAARLGVGLTNYAEAGASMLSGVTGTETPILTQMLRMAPPTRHDIVVCIVGTNDVFLNGSDPTALAAFAAGLQTGLLHVTSRRRTPTPRTPREILLARQHKLRSVDDGCPVWVGLMPRESIYGGAGSSAARDLYVAATIAVVAAVAAQGRRVYAVDLGTAYDPDTQGGDPPNNVHPDDTGHLSIANTFYDDMVAAA